ncbi:MAG TPA: hypothetical protein DCP28_26470 [Cytophagales bacterium]|nr:hypothetical protein [Cytophagales bacterium]
MKHTKTLPDKVALNGKHMVAALNQPHLVQVLLCFFRCTTGSFGTGPFGRKRCLIGHILLTPLAAYSKFRDSGALRLTSTRIKMEGTIELTDL